MTEDFFFLRPLAGEKLPVGLRLLPSNVPAIFTAPPKLGLVITTYGAGPYIALALEIRKRRYADLPVLVHDDAGGQDAALSELCREYGCDLQINSSRLGHEMGDLSGIVGGLAWAKDRGIELLVKMSRRFVPLIDWTAGLRELAMATQYGTYGRACGQYGFPLRTECFGMFVGHWSLPEIAGEMSKYMLTNRVSILAEKYLFEQATKVHAMRCVANRRWEEQNVKITPRPVFADWNFVPPDRRIATADFLSPKAGATAEVFAAVAKRNGLNYTADDFVGFSSQAGM